MSKEANSPSLNDWVGRQIDVQIVMDGLDGSPPAGSDVWRATEPVIHIQQKMGAMRPHPPEEVFTTEDPPIDISSVDFENGPIEIDELLGLYLPDLLKIKIYKRPIDLASGALKVEPADLEHVVRVHEYAHAFVHLGTEQAPPQDWEIFIGERHHFFSQISEHAHELLAQLITWGLLGSRTLQDAFLKLMARQSEEYQLSDDEREISLPAISYLLKLLRSGAFQSPGDLPQPEWQLADMLREALLVVSSGSRGLTQKQRPPISDGVAGKQLLRFAGTIGEDDLQVMSQSVDEACEKIDLDEW